MKRKEIFNKVLEKWSQEEQLTMLMEESGELISAINRYLRRRENAFPELLKEIADVEILIEQVKMFLCTGTDANVFSGIKAQKMKRLSKMVKGVK